MPAPSSCFPWPFLSPSLGLSLPTVPWPPSSSSLRLATCPPLRCAAATTTCRSNATTRDAARACERAWAVSARARSRRSPRAQRRARRPSRLLTCLAATPSSRSPCARACSPSACSATRRSSKAAEDAAARQASPRTRRARVSDGLPEATRWQARPRQAPQPRPRLERETKAAGRGAEEAGASKGNSVITRDPASYRQISGRARLPSMSYRFPRVLILYGAGRGANTARSAARRTRRRRRIRAYWPVCSPPDASAPPRRPRRPQST